MLLEEVQVCCIREETRSGISAHEVEIAFSGLPSAKARIFLEIPAPLPIPTAMKVRGFVVVALLLA